MNSIEAIKLAYDRKMIRRKDWSNQDCVVIRSRDCRDTQYPRLIHGVFRQNIKKAISDNAYTFHADDILANDWEVINE